MPAALEREIFSERLREMRKLILTSMLVFAVCVNADLIVNGGFESPDASGTAKGYTRYSGTQIDGWVIPDGYQVDLCHELWISDSGLQSLDLNPDGVPGKIAQQMQTTVGLQYLVNFSLAGNPTVGHPPYLKEANVMVAETLDGTPTATQYLSFDVTATNYANMGWTTEEFIFTATSDTTWLIFENITDGNCGIALDNVGVNVVPEPASMLILALGGLLIRKK